LEAKQVSYAYYYLNFILQRTFMKWLSLFLACVLVISLTGCDYTPRPLPPIEIYFSPQGGCTEAVVAEIEAARSSILVQAYSFTSAPIAKAIVDAHKRGVHVEVILDRSHKTAVYSSADFLQHAGIPVSIDSEHAIAHNKIMIIDGQTVITGSFNFTKQAEKNNAENLLVIRDQAIAQKYTTNWKLHAGHSEEYLGKTEGFRESDWKGE
jgi:phosphatidylserine/phosphatidylglycerophosphate/cardiolipin synthase-like enzyme